MKIFAKIFTTSLFLLGGAFFVFGNVLDNYRLKPNTEKTISQKANPLPVITQDKVPKPEIPIQSLLPEKVKHDVIFYSQAPDSNWGEPWQETCEEASIALALAWLSDPEMSKDRFRAELLRMVDWQKEHFGDYKHSDVQQSIQMMQSLYPEAFGEGGSQGKIRLHQSMNQTVLYETLASGSIIIAPFDGKALKNPNFTNGGPAYHMSLIVGYHKKKDIFYVHDVGTRKGEYYEYSSDTILEALHDWSDAGISSAPARWIEVLPASKSM